MALISSWVESANDARSPFPLNNLPYGVFSAGDGERRCGVAIGTYILDLHAAETAGVVQANGALSTGGWNCFMAQGRSQWTALREELQQMLAEGGAHRSELEKLMVLQSRAQMFMPFEVAEYTDFYASRHHATNVGTMFRGAENALPPNWLHIPIGYNGRASSVVVSGTDVRRPWGQIKGPDDAVPRFAPSARFDIELEMGAIVGTPSSGPLTVKEADNHIFGYVLLNDWSARDIQAWEYQPLGPFQSKATATSISPWIVTTDALSEVRCTTPAREVKLLPHLQDDGPMLYDIELAVSLAPSGHAPQTIARTNYNEMYYSSAQQLAHHTSSGCAMRTGDLLGSGTISGSQPGQRGSLLELSWGGQHPFVLEDGQQRSFLEDGDTVTLSGAARGEGYTIGFGECSGTVLPAMSDPYARR